MFVAQDWTTAFLGLGSNMGDRFAHLRAAVDGLTSRPCVQVREASPVYETEALTPSPSDDQPPFLNAVIRIDIECSPHDLLQIVQKIESEEGRRRKGRDRWAPRSLDIDLLTVGDVTCDTDELTLPHPRIAERRFVLRPWADLAPNLVLPPPFDASVQELLERCADSLAVRRTSDTLSTAIPNSTEQASDDGE